MQGAVTEGLMDAWGEGPYSPGDPGGQLYSWRATQGNVSFHEIIQFSLTESGVLCLTS